MGDKKLYLKFKYSDLVESWILPTNDIILPQLRRKRGLDDCISYIVSKWLLFQRLHMEHHNFQNQ